MLTGWKIVNGQQETSNRALTSIWICLFSGFYFLCQVDRLEDELMGEQEKLKGITEELEQTFAEMSGY